ncbi:DUF7563 family protein [Halostagnicola kamekurae]|uniref:DUF7563 family protein n=1 Tax=Halostagnicola kamekurae TaxID=619731 RepID=UPI00373FD5B5
MTVAPWPSVNESTCQNCGSHVTDRFGRVFGDENDRAHRCGNCDSYRRLSRGSAAGLEVRVPDCENGGRFEVMTITIFGPTAAHPRTLPIIWRLGII